MRRICLSVLLLMFAGIAGEIVAQPSNYKVVFNTPENSQTDDYDIYSIGLDGSARKNITKNKDVAWTYYAWKNRLFFVSDRDACKRCYFLYESDADGNNVRKISNLQLEDSWMGSRNDGKELVVSGRVGTTLRSQLFLINSETGHFRQLTNEPTALFRDPSFSPDGKQIVYVYKKNRTDRSEIEELYIMNADGTNHRKLTTYPKDDPLGKDPGYHVGPPHWNAKYNFISYQSNQAGKQSIYAVSPDGKKQWKLTDSKLDEGWHDWSADGEWLAFDSRDEVSGRYDIYLMNFGTKETKKLTADSPMKLHQAPVFVASH